MTRCPSCSGLHRGPRQTQPLQAEALRVLARSTEQGDTAARLCLRINFLRLGLELLDFCADCVLKAQGNPGSAKEATGGEAVILQFPQRDLLDIAAKYDSERKP